MNQFISQSGSRPTLRELWQTRYLVGQLMWRDLTVRYRQTWLGGLWAVINPALNLAMYYAVFGLMVRFSPPEYQAPYALVLLCGLVLWMLFAGVVNAVGDTLLNNLPLVQKIYFPRVALTLAGLGVSWVDFMLALILLGVLLPLCGVPLRVERLPVLILSAGLTALLAWGVGCLVAIAKLRFRDFRHIVPLLLQGMFYATPVVWTPGLLPAAWHPFLALNPLNGLTGLCRYALLDGPVPPVSSLCVSLVGSLLFAAVGYLCFVRYEARVIDRE